MVTDPHFSQQNAGLIEILSVLLILPAIGTMQGEVSLYTTDLLFDWFGFEQACTADANST